MLTRLNNHTIFRHSIFSRKHRRVWICATPEEADVIYGDLTYRSGVIRKTIRYNRILRQYKIVAEW